MTGLDPANMQLEPVDSPVVIGSLLAAALAVDLLSFTDDAPAAELAADRAALPYWLIRTTSASELRRYHDDQKRDPDGTWGDGIPGPSAAGDGLGDFDPISAAEGTYGELSMGVDHDGTVRWAFNEGGKHRVVDLSGGDFEDLHQKLTRILDDRDDAEADDTLSGTEIYTDDAFADGDHSIELYGSGIIAVIFGAGDPDDDDPFTLLLDPPST